MPLSNTEKCVIDVLDYRGIRTVFTEKRWKVKAVQHPELKSPKFLRNVERTLREPQEVWEDYGDPKNRRCYYRKYSVKTHVKVVVWMRGDCQIITAFETNYIKETNYSHLKRFV